MTIFEPLAICRHQRQIMNLHSSPVRNGGPDATFESYASISTKGDSIARQVARTTGYDVVSSMRQIRVDAAQFEARDADKRIQSCM